MTGIIMDLEQDSFISYFVTVPIVRPRQLSIPLDELGQLFHGTTIIVLTAFDVNERVGFLLDVFVRGD